MPKKTFVLAVGGLALVAASLMLPTTLEASTQGCFECHYHFLDGGEWFDDWYFVHCALSDAQNAAWTCWVDPNDVCWAAGVCGDYVYV